MPIITLPDGSKKVFEKSVTVLEIAQSIGAGLAKATIAGKVNDVLLDATLPIEKDAEVVIITSKDKEGVEIIRHSFAHLIGHAVKQIYPNIKMAIGPVIEDGFYYDIFSEYRFTPDDLNKIEERINKLIKTNYDVEILQVSKKEAIKTFQERDETFKLRIIEEIEDKGLINLYKHEEYIDMCRGPHVPNTRHLRHFKLLKLSGSYWRGNSENESLQRIYGTAWAKEKELNDYLIRIEEAEKRDHRKLGKKHSLFHIQEESPGMIFWHPNGWTIYQVLEKYIREILKKNDYLEIKTPQAVDKSLWEKSGHWEKFRDDMFTTASENRTYAIKPMNCPCHIQVFNQGLKSYKDLPIRLAEFGSCHRNEPSGALHGLMRVRGFTQDDGHIFLTENQIESETATFIDLLSKVYADLGFNEFEIKLSTRPEKRVGSDEIWDKAELSLKNAIEKLGLQYRVDEGDGAFYGPKLDFVLTDAIGRKWQCGTLQLDFNLADRLDAQYVAEDGNKYNPVMFHRAILGSFERFIGILIENYSGNLPLWLAPTQVTVCSITDEADDYVKEISETLKSKNIRCNSDLRNEKISYKVREHSVSKVPIIIAVGKKEVSERTVSVRRLGSDDTSILSLDDFTTSVVQESLAPNK